MEENKQVKIKLSTILIIIALIAIIILVLVLVNNMKDNNSNSGKNEIINNETSNLAEEKNITNEVQNEIESEKNVIFENKQDSNDVVNEIDYEVNNMSNVTNINDNTDSTVNNTSSTEKIKIIGRYYLPNSDNFYNFKSNGDVTFTSEDLTIDGKYEVVDNQIKFTEVKRVWQNPETGEVTEEEREENEVTFIINDENSFTVYEEGETYTYVKD